MNRTSLLTLGLMSLALSACGGSQQLSRPDGTRPVPTAIGADAPASPDQLMAQSPQAKPDRRAEPLKRSEERTDDPFDLPPQ